MDKEPHDARMVYRAPKSFDLRVRTAAKKIGMTPSEFQRVAVIGAIEAIEQEMTNDRPAVSNPEPTE